MTYLTIKQVAEIMNCSKSTVYRWLNKGLYYFKSDITRIRDTDLEKWLKANTYHEKLWYEDN